MRSLLSVSGQVQLEFLDRDGNVLQTQHHNQVVYGGLKWVVDRIINGNAGTTVGFIAMGDGTTPTTPNDVALAHETARMALLAPGVREEVILDRPSANYTAMFDVGTGTGNVTELGLFLASGVMAARTVFSTQIKSSTTSIRVKWTLTLKAS